MTGVIVLVLFKRVMNFHIPGLLCGVFVLEMGAYSMPMVKKKEVVIRLYSFRKL